ncbi:endo alpha-1,4 polygalactosaminidase [Nonomuraea typhae]|uniref:endo alpha-1,4 polygalactosaminidase n=1 Tax=Nonomuraea typhae TaxID=2603600 RepID=UPI0012F78A3C|nr:endo alpha-1,4 polygalactosaminidase [Nonomuraea typhae]
MHVVSAIALALSTLTPQASTAPQPLPAPVACDGCWKPALSTSWQWQLSAPPKPPFADVQMYDIDGFAARNGTLVKQLKAAKPGRGVVCYISAGSAEKYRPDVKRFPKAIVGKPLDGWPDERWLDIRQYKGKLGEIMKSRLDMCKAAGFDAVEPDNIDAYTNDSGFPLKAADQLAYNAWLANEAHRRGLSIALKGDLDQIPQLLPYYDFAINEQCFQYGECAPYDRFVKAGKAVFQVEYELPTSKFCAKANARNFNSMKKNLDLDATRTPCRGV